jgi:CHASE2 domain-containing sensor protein
LAESVTLFCNWYGFRCNYLFTDIRNDFQRSRDIAVPINSVFIVFICSGLIGELSFPFKTDLSYLLAFIFHLIGTLALFSIMMFLNNWLINWQTLFIFILAYAMIWLVIRLTQERDIRRINRQIKKRNKQKVKFK